jgi:dTDP-4-dehydrorhamnose reductase
MKILVLGSTGMAGHMVTSYLKNKGYTVHTASRADADYLLDISNIETITNLFAVLNEYDYVINCIGVLVKNSEDNVDNAILVNAWFPRYLEKTLAHSATRIIHLSTDCVFSGSTGYYKEDDIQTETNTYGRTKSLGEINNHKDITFRLSIIGPELKQGTGFFNWVTKSLDYELTGWENALWNGITTLQLGKCIEQYINNPLHTGVYHLVNNSVQISKYELALLINTIFDCKKTIKKTKSTKDINKVLISTKPEYYNIPNYHTQLIELKKYMLDDGEYDKK